MKIEFDSIWSDDEEHEETLKREGRPIAIYFDGEPVGHIYPWKEHGFIAGYELYIDHELLNDIPYNPTHGQLNFAKAEVRRVVNEVKRIMEIPKEEQLQINLF